LLMFPPSLLGLYYHSFHHQAGPDLPWLAYPPPPLHSLLKLDVGLLDPGNIL
jgi:hypothetical protein